MNINELLNIILDVAPLSLQESYDNCGLIVGDPQSEVRKVLLCIDITEAVVNEAVEKKCELIISHHPIIFKGLKRLTPASYVERVILHAIRNNIAIAAMHTNLDNSIQGVNKKIADILGLNQQKILQPTQGILKKLVTFCPESHVENVRNAIFEAGAGQIGKYDCCSFNTNGTGTFRAGAEANPFVGEIGKMQHEGETRIETILPAYLTRKVIHAMIEAHPYEEVAYDLYPLENTFDSVGAGMLGSFEKAMSETKFLDFVMELFGTPVLRHSPFTGKLVQKIAVCGGSGAFLLPAAMKANADVFLTADAKYHDFFETENSILFVDAGHYETEQFTKELIADILRKKIPNFAVLFSEVNTNAVGYYFKSKS
ncbi:MAG: Nif3-like dinuclear metal center hexameric protein [Bacteroidetes bacterium]|nr:Nif3-like dinuclear metal center hexameric protein [Bacteroidota bacterium]